LSSSNLLLSNIKLLKFSKHKEQFTFKTLSFILNTRPYNKLDKKVTDFKELKNEPAVPHTTKYFYCQDGKDIDNNKKCKTHTQHQKQIKHCRTIACSFAYTQHKKKIGAQLEQQLQHIPMTSPHNKNMKV